jgi:hypothetical protein
VAVLDEVAGALDGGTLLDVLKDLRIAGLEADDEQAAAGILHGFQRVTIRRYAGRAAPGDAERLELFAKLDGADLLDVEGVVIEEELLDVREVIPGPLHLGRYIVRRALAPRVAGERLRPQAEGALRWAAAGGVERDVRVQQERHVVPRHVHIALVDLGRPGHRVQVFDLRAIRIVLDHAVRIFVADAEDFMERFAVGKLDYGVVELATADKVEDFALVESAVLTWCGGASSSLLPSSMPAG